jgi:hypothetical protein
MALSHKTLQKLYSHKRNQDFCSYVPKLAVLEFTYIAELFTHKKHAKTASL